MNKEEPSKEQNKDKDDTNADFIFRSAVIWGAVAVFFGLLIAGTGHVLSLWNFIDAVNTVTTYMPLDFKPGTKFILLLFLSGGVIGFTFAAIAVKLNNHAKKSVE